MVQKRFQACGHWGPDFDLHDWCAKCRKKGKSSNDCSKSSTCEVCEEWPKSWFDYTPSRSYQDKKEAKERRASSSHNRHSSSSSSSRSKRRDDSHITGDSLSSKLDIITDTVSIHNSGGHNKTKSSPIRTRTLEVPDVRKDTDPEGRHRTLPARDSGDRTGSTKSPTKVHKDRNTKKSATKPVLDNGPAESSTGHNTGHNNGTGKDKKSPDTGHDRSHAGQT